ncbi:MAG: acyltransferase family protein, partial [Acidimicrobiia bacterium]|nr:acyltransferase family protein [Acidimicrobiia bacterium]
TWLLASIAQVTFAWALSIGLIGLFRAILSVERRGIRYLSDSSYWLYVAHVPLVILVQALVNDWELPSFVKLSGITIGVILFLLVTYQLFIRYTLIGTMLNGKRTRPAAG